jgi:hypothetical protein
MAAMIINQVNRHKEPLEDTNFIHLYPPFRKGGAKNLLLFLLLFQTLLHYNFFKSGKGCNEITCKPFLNTIIWIKENNSCIKKPNSTAIKFVNFPRFSSVVNVNVIIISWSLQTSKAKIVYFVEHLIMLKNKI